MLLPIAGVNTYGAALDAPPGSMIRLEEMVMDMPGEARVRNGFQAWGQTNGGDVGTMMPFEGRMYVHYGGTKLGFFVPDGTFTQVSGTYTPAFAGRPVAWTEADGVLLMSFKEGQYRVAYDRGTDAYEFRLSAPPVILDATAVASGSTGWLPADAAVAYRALAGYRDVANRLVLGAPGQRLVFSYPGAASVGIGGLVRTGGNLVTVTTLSPHFFASGWSTFLDAAEVGPPAFGVGPHVITVTGPSTFTYVEVGANGASAVAHTVEPAPANVTVTQRLPPGLQAGDFLQLYRTQTADGAGTEPGEIMRLVYERILTNGDIAAGSVTLLDETPDTLAGQYLYCNPEDGAGVGIEQANYPPPAAGAMAAYRGCTLWGETYGYHGIEITLLGIGGDVGLIVGDFLTFVYGQQRLGSLLADNIESAGGSRFQLFTNGTPAQNIAATANSMVRVINAGPLRFLFRAFYLSGPNDPPGRIRIERLTLAGLQFAVLAWAHGSAWSPAVPNYVGWDVGATRAGGVVTVPTLTPHGYTPGLEITVFAFSPDNDPNFPQGTKIVATTPTPTSFTYAEAGPDAVLAAVYYSADQALDAVSSSNDYRPAALRTSAPYEPDGAPLLNEFLQGNLQKKLLGLTPVRDGVIMHKEDGDWRLIGDTPDDFRAVPLNPSAHNIAGPYTGTFENSALSVVDSGVLQSWETGVKELSDSVDITVAGGPLGVLDILRLLPDEVAQVGFAVLDQNRVHPRAWFWFPREPGDTYARQAWIWNQRAQAWSGPVYRDAITAAVWADTGRMYVAEPGSGKVKRERLTGTTADFVDEARFTADHAVLVSSDGQVDVIRPEDEFSSPISVAQVEVGDVYVTGVLARVVAVDVGAGTISVNTVAGQDYSDPGVLEAHIPVTLEWRNIYGREPGTRKTFEEVHPQFQDSSFTAPLVATATDWAPTYAEDELLGLGNLDVPAAPVVETAPLRQVVPDAANTGTWLRVRVRIKHGRAPIRAQGLKVWSSSGDREVRR